MADRDSGGIRGPTLQTVTDWRVDNAGRLVREAC
jgi:hypothetical protein